MLVLRCVEIPGYGAYKRPRSRWNRHATVKDLVVVVVVSVIDVSVALVLAYRSAIEIDAGENAFTARIGEEFGIHIRRGVGLRVAADRSSSSRGVTANLELALEQCLHAILVHRHQHQIRSLRANLKTKGTASQADEYRRTPTVTGAAGHYPLSVLRTDTKRRLLHAGHYSDADSLLNDCVGNTFIGRLGKLVDDKPCLLHSIVQVSPARSGKCGSGECRHTQERK